MSRMKVMTEEKQVKENENKSKAQRASRIMASRKQKNRALTHQRVSCGLVLKENDRHETTTQSKGRERIEEGNTEQSAAHTYKRVHLK